MLSEKTFHTGTLQLNYAEGANNGAPLLLIHGAAARWQRLQKLIDRLEPDWHLYAVDLRGHGKSDRAGEQYHLNEYAADVAAFLRGVVDEPAVLVGHSLGAMTAVSVAARAPESVRALILLDPPLYLHNLTIQDSPGGGAWFKTLRDLIRSAKSYEDILEGVRASEPQASEEEIQIKTANVANTDPAMIDVLLRHELLQDYDLADTLQHISCPTLLLYGDWDKGAVVREEDVEFFRANKPDVVSARFPNTSHNVPDERTEQVIREMAKFLK
jgi:pimeloyl-ACP methyl ester carboxylesterase